MQLSAMAAAVKRDTPLGSWPHPRLFPRTERALAVLFLGSTPAVWMKGPGLFVTKREIRGLGGFCITPENNSSSYESSTSDPSRVVVRDETGGPLRDGRSQSKFLAVLCVARWSDAAVLRPSLSDELEGTREVGRSQSGRAAVELVAWEVGRWW